MKVALVLGTRPEIVKLSPIIRELRSREIDYVILHTGQHYDYNMDGAFFRDLDLPLPGINLGVGSGSHSEQTAKIMIGVEKVLVSEKPSMTLVQGDTNTVLGGALVASKLHFGLGHVEAGLRSFDRAMPEEVNRVVADHLSDLLFAPTEVSRGNLLREGIDKSCIHVTGNTVVDAVRENLKISESRRDILEKLGVARDGYILVTLHRAENVDDEFRIRNIVEVLRRVGVERGVDVVFPMHPRTRKMVAEYELSLEGFRCVEPLGYLEFLQVESNARLILTDSGGVQEEACVLGVPCVTLRDNTERPETVEVGANIVAGTGPDSVLSAVDTMMSRKGSWYNPFGNGDAGEKIVRLISEN